MTNFTELSAKDINEVNGGRISPLVIAGPIVAPLIPCVPGIVLGALVGAALRK